MKTLFSIVLFILVLTAKAQDGIIHIKAGPAYSYIQDADNKLAGIGYLAGLDFEQRISKALAFTGNVYYLHQANAIQDRHLKSSSANLGFGFNVYLVSKLSVMAGVDVGFVINNKTEGELVMDGDDQRWGYVFGVGHNLSERLKLQARYMTAINKQWFDSTGQLAVAYRISKPE